MATHRITTTVPVPVALGKGCGFDLLATVRFSYTPARPATRDDPPDAAEVDDVEVVGLIIDIPGAPKTVHCPQWLADLIAENCDQDALAIFAEENCEMFAVERRMKP